MAATRLVVHPTTCNHLPAPSHTWYVDSSSASLLVYLNGGGLSSWKQCRYMASGRNAVTPRVSPGGRNEGIVPADIDDDGVSLGTMKLPPNTDIPRFETLLFQWANSLCQGAYLPLPVPLKVDKIQGGARLGFIEIDEGKTEMPVYIDCLVFPATKNSGPLFRATRNGPLKEKEPPGEQRIMRSLLQALQTSVEIARL